MTNHTDMKPMKAVYCYYFPEVRRCMEMVANIPDDLFKVTGDADKTQQALNDVLKLKKPLVLPRTPEDYVDLDLLHEPVIDRVIDAYGPHIKGLEGFTNRYPTSGSSAGLFHLLAEFAASGGTHIYCLDGEYEGYAAYGCSVGLHVVTVDDISEAPMLEPGMWFLSNPSARDGNIIPNRDIKQLLDAGHTMVLDCSYVGSTRSYEFDASHPNVVAVLISFSKPYGVFRFRIGFTLTRQPVPSLYATKWFKDIGRLLAAVKLVDQIPPGSLAKLYRSVQAEAVKLLNIEQKLQAEPSDVVLLASAPPSSKADTTYASYRRHGRYRFCLTPYFEYIESDGIRATDPNRR